MNVLQRWRAVRNLQGDRLSALPLLVVYLTDGCNSKCVTCDIWRSPRRNMPLALAESLAAEAQALGTRWVLLSGGEAMQHPDWPRIAQMFRQTGARVLLLTNGLLLKRQIEATLASVDEVILSLDGAQASTYAAVRGVDGLALVLEGLRLLRQNGMSVTTRTTVQRANYAELGQIIDLGLAYDVTTISFLALDVSNREAFGPRTGLIPLDSVSVDDPRSLSALPPGALSVQDCEALADLIDALARDYAPHFAQGRIAESPDKLRRTLLSYFRALHGLEVYPAPPCNAPHFSVVVECDGRIRPCYFLPTVGQLRPDEPALSQALNADDALAMRRAYRQGQRPECGRCVCPLYKSARGLWSM
ncbi:MAG: radical SAM protein [Anaerolineae bacterium]|nr:radical SAM protein [Anaerolineae bacterium]MDW8173784.1 radical SAM protein [Anaerolineae bacterium]